MDLDKIARHWWGYVYDQYENRSDDVKLLLELIGNTPRNIFEVCCGTGRVLVPLAQAGHTVAGMDADEGMLTRIPAKAEGLANLKYSLANALTTDWGKDYDVVILGDNTLMNIEHRDDDKAAQMLFIKKAADALKSGGHFFVAYDIYPEPETVFIGESKVTKGYYSGSDDTGVWGQIFHCGGLYNPVTQIAVWANHTELTMPNGEVHIIPGHGHKYVCTRNDVHGWLRDAGFMIEKEFGGCDRRPFIGEQGWDIVWARKI
jgi:SAM-dependent methyltransferase